MIECNVKGKSFPKIRFRKFQRWNLAVTFYFTLYFLEFLSSPISWKWDLKLFLRGKKSIHLITNNFKKNVYLTSRNCFLFYYADALRNAMHASSRILDRVIWHNRVGCFCVGVKSLLLSAFALKTFIANIAHFDTQ